MRRINILGVDPSLSNFGCVAAHFDPETGELEPFRMMLYETKPFPKKRKLKKNYADYLRVRQLHDGFRVMQQCCDVVIAEMPHGSQSARAAASYGMVLSVVASTDLPLIQVTAEQVKIAACDNRIATKQDMIDWAVDAFPDAPWFRHGGRLSNKNEHLADACGALVAGMQTEHFEEVLEQIAEEERAFWK